MFTDETRKQAIVFAVNHRELITNNAFAAKLRWLDASKTYLIEDITQAPDGDFAYAYRGEFTGTQLKTDGLPIDLDAGEERCAAFWIQERTAACPQVLYADAAVAGYRERISGEKLVVQVQGRPRATARLMVFKPGAEGVENRTVALDGQGRATATFDAATISDAIHQRASGPATTLGRRDTATAGGWHGKYGATAAWLAGQKIGPAGGFSLTTSAPVYVWGKDNATPRVLALPPGRTAQRSPPAGRRANSSR